MEPRAEPLDLLTPGSTSGNERERMMDVSSATPLGVLALVVFAERAGIIAAEPEAAASLGDAPDTMMAPPMPPTS